MTEETLVPDPSLTIREGAVAAWPGAWQGQNLRDILVTLGYDIDKPWRKLPKRQRNWILFTDEQPTVEIDPGQHPVQADYYYNGTFSSAERHVRHTLANSHSAMMRRRVLQFVDSVECPLCGGSGLRPEALKVTFAGRTIADYVAMPLADLADTLRPTASRTDAAAAYESTNSGELTEVATMIAADLVARLQILIDLGLGYLSLSRRTPTVSPGELQRLRLATQLRAGLFGVLYVLDEPSAGLHPADAEPLLDVLDRLRRAGNSLFVVEHDMDVVRRADWIVDVGPGAGELGGDVLYSGPVPGLADVEGSVTRRYLFDGAGPPSRQSRTQSGRLRLRGICFHNLRDLDVDLPLGVYTAVTGVSGSGKSTLVVKVLGDVVNSHLGTGRARRAGRIRRRRSRHRDRRSRSRRERRCDGRGGRGDQPAGISRPAPDRTHAALDAGDLHRLVRRRAPRIRRDPEGASPRLDTRAGFRSTWPTVAAPPVRGRGSCRSNCCSCRAHTPHARRVNGARYSDETLEVRYRDRTIADVLAMTVDEASEFLRRRRQRGAEPDHAARGRTGISPSRTARDRAVRWRGAADQARLRTAAAPARAHPLRPRRADHRAAPRRCGSARSSTAPPRRRGQYRGGGRTRHADGRRRGLGDRPGTGRRQRRRSRRCGGPTEEGGTCETQPHGAVSGEAVGAVSYSMKKLSFLMNHSRRSSSLMSASWAKPSK